MLKVPIDWLSDWLIDWFFSLITHAFTDTSYTTLLWTVLLASKDTKLKKHSLATAPLFSGSIPNYSRR